MYLVAEESELLQNKKIVSRVAGDGVTTVVTDSKRLAEEMGLVYMPTLLAMVMMGKSEDKLLVVTNMDNRYDQQTWEYLMQEECGNVVLA